MGGTPPAPGLGSHVPASPKANWGCMIPAASEFLRLQSIPSFALFISTPYFASTFHPNIHCILRLSSLEFLSNHRPCPSYHTHSLIDVLELVPQYFQIGLLSNTHVLASAIISTFNLLHRPPAYTDHLIPPLNSLQPGSFSRSQCAIWRTVPFLIVWMPPTTQTCR